MLLCSWVANIRKFVPLPCLQERYFQLPLPYPAGNRNRFNSRMPKNDFELTLLQFWGRHNLKSDEIIKKLEIIWEVPNHRSLNTHALCWWPRGDTYYKFHPGQRPTHPPISISDAHPTLNLKHLVPQEREDGSKGSPNRREHIQSWPDLWPWAHYMTSDKDCFPFRLYFP